jgi:hypothetical protein
MGAADLTPTLVQQVPPLTLTESTWYITNTRVALGTVVHAYQDGATAEEVVAAYPSLLLPEIYCSLPITCGTVRQGMPI